MLKLLSLIFAAVRFIAHAEWLTAFVLVWWGYVRLVRGFPEAGYTAMAVAAIIALLSLAGKALNHAIFWPDSRPLPSTGPASFPMQLRGAASGSLRGRAGIGYEVHAAVLGQPVHIVWMGESAIPHLAVAGERYHGQFYPGSRVRPGWVYALGRRRYGVELSFLGKRLLLALDDEGAADQVRRWLEDD